MEPLDEICDAYRDVAIRWRELADVYRAERDEAQTALKDAMGTIERINRSSPATLKAFADAEKWRRATKDSGLSEEGVDAAIEHWVEDGGTTSSVLELFEGRPYKEWLKDQEDAEKWRDLVETGSKTVEVEGGPDDPLQRHFTPGCKEWWYWKGAILDSAEHRECLRAGLEVRDLNRKLGKDPGHITTEARPKPWPPGPF